MTRPVTIVVRGACAREELEASLAALLGELEWRAAGDEVLLLDEEGRGELEGWAATRFPPPATFERASFELRTLVRTRGGSAPSALRAALAEATHEHVFVMSPRLRVGAQFLEPLCAALEDERVFAAVPALRGAGPELGVEAFWRAGELDLGPPADPTSAELAFLPLEALMARRDELVARPLDGLFDHGPWLGRDLAWRARREGRAIVRVAAASVELPPGGAVESPLEEACGRLLFTWKHLDEEELWREHQAALLARTVRAAEEEDRDSLLALALALDQLPALARSRPSGSARLRFRALLGREGEGRELDA
ncbi:MAG: hypothetical protein IPJ19_00545 [Planctomycetes bacterium]|nr:hypothetical protein [Planctomycetota bacterium]